MAVTIKDLRFSIYLNNADAVKSAMQFQTQLQKVGDEMAQLSAQGKKDTPEYREKKKAFDELTKSMEQSKLQGGLLALSWKELQKLSKTMKGDLSRMVPQSDEWKKLDADIKVVDKRIAHLKETTGNTESSLSKMATGFNKYFGVASAAIGGIVAVGMAFYASMKKAIEFSKAVSELSALTGANGADLDYLKNKARELGKEYGKSAVEIVTAMKLVGSAKPELLENVQALAEVTDNVLLLSKASGMDLTEATNDVTTIMNQFGLQAIESSRTINVLAAGSKYGAKEVDYLGESISKVGTVAKSAHISLEKTTAVMELFGEKGVKAEIAGNGFKSILVKLQADTKNYTNGVFDLNKAIDNNQKIAGNNIELQKRFGQEYFNLAQILFQNKARFEELTKQVTGTSTALDMAKTAADNLSGDIDKMASSWDNFVLSLEDGKGPIANAFRGLIQWAKDAVDAMAELSKNDDQKAMASGERMAKSRIESLKGLLREQSKLHQQQLENEKDPVKRQKLQENYDKKRIEYVNSEIQSGKNLANNYVEKANALANENKQTADWIVSTEKYLKGSRDINFERTKNLAIAKNDFEAKNKEIKTLRQSANAYYTYVNSVGALSKAMEQIPTSITPTKPDPGTGKPDKNPYKKRLEELDRQLLQEQVSLKKANKSKEDTDKEMLELDVKYLTKKRDLYKKDSAEWLEFENKLVDIELTKKTDANKANILSIQDSYQAISDATTIYEQQKKEELQNSLDDGLITQDEYNAKIVALDVTLAEKRLQNAKNYQELISDATFNSEEDKKKAVEAANSAVTAANKVLLKANKAVSKLKLDEEKRHLDEVAKLRKELGLDREVLGYKAGLAALKANLKKVAATEKESADAIAKYKAGKVKEYAETAQQLVSGISDFVSAKNEAETSKLEAEKNKQLAAAGDNADKREAIEKDFAKRELELKKKQAKANLGISIAQAMATGALGIANIWAKEGVNPILAGILTAVLVGVTAAQIGAAKAQNDAIQSTQLWTGGYTGDGGEREPAGIVHKGEFVANAKAVRNPQVKKFLDVFNAAQLNGSIHMLNTTQILEKVRAQPSAGYQAGGYVQNSNGAVGSVSSDVSMAIISENARQMERLNAHLDKGILSYSVVSGDYGSVKQTERYVKMKANASR